MNKATISLIKFYESLHDGDLTTIGLQPKMDPLGIWTEGYGRAMINPATKEFLKGAPNKDLALKLASIHTEEEACTALDADLKRYATIAANKVGAINWGKLNANQQGALTSFVYNCGTGVPQYKIFLNIVNYLKGTMSQQALIDYWKESVVRGGGVRLPGLVKRRAKEAQLFFAPLV